MGNFHNVLRRTGSAPKLAPFLKLDYTIVCDLGGRKWVVSGVWVSDELRDIANKSAKSKARGRAFFSELAAKQIAILKDIGYRNTYISGRPQLKRIQGILALANSFGENDWKDFAKEINFAQNDRF